LYLVRRVTAFAGAQAFSFVLSSFLAADGILLGILFAFRFDYGRLYITVSFLTTLIVTFLFNTWNSTYAIPRFYVVPFGNIEPLSAIKRVEWIELAVPVLHLLRTCDMTTARHGSACSRWRRSRGMRFITLNS
jgi:hypothetical protein